MPGYDRSAYVVYLSRVPMFSKCNSQQLERLAASTAERDVDAGEDIVREGSEGDEFFVIADGAASVARGGRAVATLAPGDYFGELALLDPAPRNASVSTTKDTTLAAIDVRIFRAVLRDVPAMSEKLLAGLARRVREADISVG